MIYAYHIPPLSNPDFDKFGYHGTNRGSRSLNLLIPSRTNSLEKILGEPGVKYYDVLMDNVSHGRKSVVGRV